MITSIDIVEKKPLEKMLRVCAYCLDLLTLEGYINSNFVIPAIIFKKKCKCDICGVNEAVYAVIPRARGLYLCKECYDVICLGRHKWQAYKCELLNQTKDIECDLCTNKADLYLIPPRIAFKGKK